MFICLDPVYTNCTNGYGHICDNGSRCVSHYEVCNGRTACQDGSDELNCSKTNINIYDVLKDQTFSKMIVD